METRERTLASRSKVAVYVYTGPLFERPMRPMPKGGVMHRVPSGYWKVVAMADGRYSSFLFDQNTPRRADHCDSRTSLTEVQLRSRLMLFPTAGALRANGLDAELGCTKPPPAPQPPGEITTR